MRSCSTWARTSAAGRSRSSYASTRDRPGAGGASAQAAPLATSLGIGDAAILQVTLDANDVEAGEARNIEFSCKTSGAISVTLIVSTSYQLASSDSKLSFVIDGGKAIVADPNRPVSISLVETLSRGQQLAVTALSGEGTYLYDLAGAEGAFSTFRPRCLK